MFNIITVIQQSNNNGKQSKKSVDLLTNSMTTYELGLCSHKYKRIYYEYTHKCTHKLHILNIKCADNCADI